MAEAHYMAITVNGSAFFFLFADTGQWTHSPGKCAIPFRKKKITPESGYGNDIYLFNSEPYLSQA